MRGKAAKPRRTVTFEFPFTIEVTMTQLAGQTRTFFIILFMAAAALPAARESPADPRLRNAFRRPAQNGWTFVHLAGSPGEIGYQHGYLLAPEILDAKKVVALELAHDNRRDWEFYRNQARTVLWPHVEDEYRKELQGIAEGATARDVKLDLWDIVALNATLEWPYFMKQYNKEHGIKDKIAPPGDHCSAFVATGSYTADGKVVMAQNNWTQYLDGERWTIIFDVVPSQGHHFIMDGFPGLIHSADDFGINDAGIMITETTIQSFHGWDSNGVPEFMRARKAMQYAESIDDFARIMKQSNNGGYANDWLVADNKTNEVASLELGLKHVTLDRSKDGYFVGSNFPINPKLAKEETDFNLSDRSGSANARHIRWDQLMRENKGRINLQLAEEFLGDHLDTFDRREEPDERTLCGHIDLSRRGSGEWQPPYGPAGTVQNKATDSTMAQRMSFVGHIGHACGLNFHASEHLARHPEFNWQKDLLRDLNARDWTGFAPSETR
jgi:hypothetical protein